MKDKLEIERIIEINNDCRREVEVYLNDYDFWVCYGGLELGGADDTYERLREGQEQLERLKRLFKAQRPKLFELSLLEEVSESGADFFRTVRDLRDKIPWMEEAVTNLQEAHKKRVVEESYTNKFDALHKVRVTCIKETTVSDSGKPVSYGEKRAFCPGSGKWLEKDRVTPIMIETDKTMNCRLARMRKEPGYVANTPAIEELKVYGYGKKPRPYTKARKQARRDRHAIMVENFVP